MANNWQYYLLRTAQPKSVIPAKAGIPLSSINFARKKLDPCLRKDDGIVGGGLAALRKARGKQLAPKMIAKSIRLEPEIVAHFKKYGAGWQKRMEEALMKVVGK